MFEGKERRRHLIEELRTTHALQEPEQKVKRAEAEEIRREQSERKKQTHKVEYRQAERGVSL